MPVLLRGAALRAAPAAVDLASIAASLVRLAGYGGWDMSVSLVSDRYMARLNRTYRGVRGATDVLSFSPHGALRAPERFDDAAVPTAGLLDLGDVFLAPAYISRRAAAAAAAAAAVAGGGAGGGGGGGADDATDVYAAAAAAGGAGLYTRLLAHGIVHLLGYDHQGSEDAAAMRAREEGLLALLRAEDAAAGGEPGPARRPS